jgi:hypothetical protein
LTSESQRSSWLKAIPVAIIMSRRASVAQW